MKALRLRPTGPASTCSNTSVGEVYSIIPYSDNSTSTTSCNCKPSSLAIRGIEFGNVRYGVEEVCYLSDSSSRIHSRMAPPTPLFRHRALLPLCLLMTCLLHFGESTASSLRLLLAFTDSVRPTDTSLP